MSWHFLPELVGASSAATFSDGAPSARSKSKRIRGRCFCAGNGTVCFPCSLSGTTSEPLTEGPGVALWISSLEDSPAKTSAPPERGGASKEPEAVSGERWHGSLARWDHATRSWRTPQCSLLEGLDVFSETWPRSGMTRSGIAFQLPPSAPLTRGTASGSSLCVKPTHHVPTPTASDHIERQETMGRLNYETNKAVTVDRWVKMWPTPKASASGPDYARSLRPKSGGDDLATAVDRERFPTPRVEDGQCAGGHRGKDDTLHACAKRWASPAARDFKSGRGRKENGHTPQLPEQVGGQLNPPWVEWLMGWPIGWTGLAPLATDRFQRWSSGHGKP